jgi:hypothetical protein
MDPIGQKYGRLTIRHLDAARSNNGARRWYCTCDCGGNNTVTLDRLKRGAVLSCGCLFKETHTKHGMRQSPEYVCWNNMLNRCLNPNNPMYQHYGARGITVCDNWRHSFEAFFNDMGPRPSEFHSIERREVNGNYERNNCKWATLDEQANNTRRNVKHEFVGKMLTVSEIAKRTGGEAETIRQRIERGLPMEDAVNPDRLNGKVFSYQGQELSIKELSTISRLPYSTLYHRLVICGWTVEDAMSKASRKAK